MPWQRMVADIGLELLPGTLIPAYREIVVTVPRQNGKTTLMLAFEIQRAIGWAAAPAPIGGPQRIAYTAQTGKDAREKLLNDQAPLLDPLMAPRLPIKAGVKRINRGVGNESVLFKTGSRIFLLNSGEEAGHGKTLDLGVIDEAFADVDDRREQAMKPAQLTRPAAQTLIISTAGTDKSPFLRRKVDTGRAAVTDGVTEGMAYFEWSARDDADIDDPATWWGCMPALGHTITEAVVRHERSTMKEGDFRRAMLNQWTISDERVIPASVWAQACSTEAAPDGGLVIGVDVEADRTAASVTVADSSRRVELIRHAGGVGWVVDYVVDKASKWGADVVLDGYGPAGSLAPEIEARGVRVHTYASREMAQACGSFYDALADGQVQIRSHPALDLAAAAVRRRQMGDIWIWGRKDTCEDVSPLVAATVAFDKADGRKNDAAVWCAWD